MSGRPTAQQVDQWAEELTAVGERLALADLQRDQLGPGRLGDEEGEDQPQPAASAAHTLSSVGGFAGG